MSLSLNSGRKKLRNLWKCNFRVVEKWSKKSAQNCANCRKFRTKNFCSRPLKFHREWRMGKRRLASDQSIRENCFAFYFHFLTVFLCIHRLQSGGVIELHLARTLTRSLPALIRAYDLHQQSFASSFHASQQPCVRPWLWKIRQICICEEKFFLVWITNQSFYLGVSHRWGKYCASAICLRNSDKLINYHVVDISKNRRKKIIYFAFTTEDFNLSFHTSRYQWKLSTLDSH